MKSHKRNGRNESIIVRAGVDPISIDPALESFPNAPTTGSRELKRTGSQESRSAEMTESVTHLDSGAQPLKSGMRRTGMAHIDRGRIDREFSMMGTEHRRPGPKINLRGSSRTR
jgi:hypothetical protein